MNRNQRPDRPVQNIVAIGAENPLTVARIKEAVLRQDAGLDIMDFTTRKTLEDMVQSEQSSFLEEEEDRVSLIFICTDQLTSGFSAGGDSGPVLTLLDVAKDLAAFHPTLKVVAITSNPQHRLALRDCGCAAILTLDETIAAIPTYLSNWLVHRW